MKLQKNRIAVWFAFIVGMLVAFSPLQAQLLSGEIEIGGYDFPTTGNEGFVPNSVHENVSMDYIAKHANISTFYMDASVRPDGTHWLISGSATGATSAALAVETDSYFHFTVTPDTGASIQFNRLLLDGMRGGGSQPRGFAVATSVDNYATLLGGADFSTQHPTMASYEVDLGSLSDIVDPVTFRIYMYSPAPSNTMYMDKIVLTANSIIPEPSTYAALIGLGMFGLVLWRRRTLS